MSLLLWLVVGVSLLLVCYLAWQSARLYWRHNVRLLRLGRNFVKLLRDNQMLLDGPSDMAAEQPGATGCESVHFSEFCDWWLRNRPASGDLPRIGRCDRLLREYRFGDLPIQLAAYVPADSLPAAWYRFTTPNSALLNDQLICDNGLVFDWSAGTVSNPNVSGRE